MKRDGDLTASYSAQQADKRAARMTWVWMMFAILVIAPAAAFAMSKLVVMTL